MTDGRRPLRSTGLEWPDAVTDTAVADGAVAPSTHRTLIQCPTKLDNRSSFRTPSSVAIAPKRRSDGSRLPRLARRQTTTVDRYACSCPLRRIRMMAGLRWHEFTTESASAWCALETS